MQISTSDPASQEAADLREAKQAILGRAHDIGFETAGIASPGAIADRAARLREFLALGRAGDMEWMETRAETRADPRRLWPAARSVVMLGMSYAPHEDPLVRLGDGRTGVISVYARGRDYHDVVKKRLKALARFIHDAYGAEVKVFVDTAPLMEKPLAEVAGLGWQGKHTNLVSRAHGSWLFLGAVMTTLALPPDRAERDRCGSCRACLDICPTRAFPTAYALDARRCISYLTIEHKGHIDPEFRAAIGNRIYGCDDCLAVCPWNKFAGAAREARFEAGAGAHAPRLRDLVALDDPGFRKTFAGTAIRRTGRDRFVRNVLIALGNSGDREAVPLILPLLEDPAPIVRAMAVWALSRLMPADAFLRLADARAAREEDAYVREEWERGAKDCARP